MKSFLLFVFLLIASATIHAQAAAVSDTILYKWIPVGAAGLNVSQIAFTNWSQGGENSITWTGTGNFGLRYKSIAYLFYNNLKIAYGRTKMGNDDFRTNNNELYLESVLSKSIGWALDPYVSNTIRSTVAAGYEYTDTSALKISDFFDPGYLTQSIGFSYDKLKGLNTRLGVAFQEVFTNKFTQYADDPDTKTKVEDFKFETGIESVTSLAYPLQDNLLLDSKLGLFTRFAHLDVWDVRWDNTITAVISKYVNVNFNILTIYEKSQSPKTQLKQALLLGLSYTLF